MSSISSRQVNYFPTESDLYDLFSKANLPQEFTGKFIKDYAAIKRNIDESATNTDNLTKTVDILIVRADNTDSSITNINSRLNLAESAITEITIRVDHAESSINSIDVRLTAAEGEVDTLRIDLDQLRNDYDDHAAESSAHGASGNIVGTDDHASPTTGGTVLLGVAVANAAASTVNVTSPDATAAPATYDQTQAQTVVVLANEMKGDINQLKDDLNGAITQLNALLASQRTALQIAP